MDSKMQKMVNALDLLGIKHLPLKANKHPVSSGWMDDSYECDESKMRGHQLGILTGKRSGITVIDIDFKAPDTFGTDPDIFPDTYTVRTPTGALQKYYQYDERINQTQKSFQKFPHVDIRNDGGYVVAVPSKAKYTKHYKEIDLSVEIEGEYTVASGSLNNLSPFPFHLFEETINETKKEVSNLQPYIKDANKPGDDFEQAVSWNQILTPHGYNESYTDKKGVTHWVRPGKKEGTSATTMVCPDGRERLFVFSTNAEPFETYVKDRHNSYNKITAYATLNHNSNFHEAVKALRNQGYGTQPVEEDKSVNKQANSMSYICMDDVEEQQIDWVWPEKIARGELCIIAGEPGASKTMVAVDLAARVSTGDTVPLGDEPICKGNVVFLTSENDPAKVLRPRLVGAGADLSKVFLISSSLTETDDKGKTKKKHVALAEDAEKIGRIMGEIDNVVLLIIDPISEYMGKKDANNNADVRDMLATLTDHVRSHNVAILAIAHFNKKTDVTSASSRINGSIGFAGAARTAFAVGKVVKDEDEDDGQEEKYFSMVKNNLSADKGGYIYTVIPHNYHKDGKQIKTAKIDWLRLMDEEADAMLAKASGRGRPPAASNKCKEWLESYLMSRPDGVRRHDVINDGARFGFSPATIDRVKDTILINKDGGLWKLLDDKAF
jgi:putative DNA primase/helicase